MRDRPTDIIYSLPENDIILDLNPNEADHSSHLTLMPEPGVPLDVTIRFDWIFG